MARMAPAPVNIICAMKRISILSGMPIWKAIGARQTGRVYFHTGLACQMPKGSIFYDRLVDATLARDLQPFCTLYHWELPQWMSDMGGWRNPDVTHHFADFAELIGERLGDRLSHIATINEPWCVSFICPISLANMRRAAGYPRHRPFDAFCASGPWAGDGTSARLRVGESGNRIEPGMV